MKKRDSFVLFRRKGKNTYYFYFWKDEKRITKTTGQTTKAAAVEAARAQIRTYNCGTFGEFAKDFFVWDTCEWIKRQHKRNRRFSKSTADNRRHYLEKHLLPEFGEMKLTEITRPKIDDFLNSLDHYSSQSKNHVLFTLKIILDYAAKDKELIPIINFNGLAFSTSDRKKRGIFTLDELKSLFPDDIIKVWGNIKHGSIFYIMLVTGTRSGEIRALTWDKWTRGGLFIDRAVKNSGEIGNTKTGEIRFVPLNSRAERYLAEWRALSPYTTQDALLFYGEGPNKPYTSRALADYFGRRLDALGFDRKDRVLCVHSLRHCFNTYMRSLLPAALLQTLTGHKSDAMTAAYDHPALEEMSKRVEPARAVLERLF